MLKYADGAVLALIAVMGARKYLTKQVDQNDTTADKKHDLEKPLSSRS